MNFTASFIAEAAEILNKLDIPAIERMVDILAQTREQGGRLFLLGVGGSAANASHAVNDFRKIVGIEAYAPTDNVSELTARTNDEGWSTVFAAWLQTSRLRAEDALLVLSVGGGDVANNVSPNLVEALQYAAEVGAMNDAPIGHPAVFLDRDGVLTEPIWNPATREYESPHIVADVVLCPDIFAPLQALQARGYELFIVSNQPSYAKGKTSLENI